MLPVSKPSKPDRKPQSAPNNMPKKSQAPKSGLTASGFRKISKQPANKDTASKVKKEPTSDIKTGGLKFENKEPIVPKNPLQVGLDAKQHAAQQDLLNLIR